MEIKIILPGNPIIKKNTAQTSFFYTDKHGRRVPRKFPIHYYSDEYKEWARGAIQACAVYKTKHPEIEFPVNIKMNLKCLFFMKDYHSVDLSGLYEGTQDVLAGNEKWSNVPNMLYKIIWDDAVRYIGSHDGSRVLLDLVHPRVEVTLTDYIL